MKGDPQVIQLLNDLVAGELTAFHQYMLHARMCENWGYERLFKKIHDESREELDHAEEIVARILFLEGVPEVHRLGPVVAGSSVHEQLRLDYDVEKAVVVALNRGIDLGRKLGDNGTTELLEDLLEDTEEHAHWLESQLALIGQMGVENYLAEQVKGGSPS